MNLRLVFASFTSLVIVDLPERAWIAKSFRSWAVDVEAAFLTLKVVDKLIVSLSDMQALGSFFVFC